MFGEMVANEDVEQVRVVVQVRFGENDELALAGGVGARGGPNQVTRIVDQQRGGDQERGVLCAAGRGEHLVVRARRPANEAKQQAGGAAGGGGRGGHEITVAQGADDGLTMG